jgi:hypothetical protein
MTRSQRAARLLLFSGAALLLSLLFRTFLVEDVVVPVATLILMLWRLLLSVHQALYWGAVIALALGLAFYRLRRVAGRGEMPSERRLDSIPQFIDYWRLPLELADSEDPADIGLKSELRHILVSVSAVKQPGAAPFAVFEALRLRQLPLPDPLHRFMFGDEANPKNHTWRKWARELAAKPGRWLRRWTGRDKAAYYQSVEETLSFLESMMEIKHGDDYFGPADD